MIRIINFNHCYQKSQVIHNLNLEIPKGTIYGLIGPNGAGKTTTLHFLATLLHPTSGQGFIDGKDVVTQSHDVRKLIGYMPDHFGIYPRMTVWQFLDFFALAYGIHGKKRTQVIENTLCLLDLQKYRNIPGEHLSRGLRQRLGLARAILHNPSVLILDEPASGLDPQARREIMEIWKELQNMGKTIIVSSHILSELASYCNTLGVLQNGTLLAQGTLGELAKFIQAYTRLQVHVSSDAKAAGISLKKLDSILRIEENGNTIMCDFSGTASDITSVISHLLQEKVPVIGVQEYIPSIEEIFFQMMQKK